MTTHAISEGEFNDLLQSIERSAFRLETRDSYALDYEREDFDRFLAGTPTPPPDLDWWRPWLDQVARLAGEGKTVSRVRVLAEPPSDYQRWMIWAAPWYAQAGEQVSYLPRSASGKLPLPLGHDWWLLDDKRVIRMWFTEAGEIDRKLLTDDREIIALYLKWRDLAVRNATTAEEIAAA
jgi:hypothetical protein